MTAARLAPQPTARRGSIPCPNRGPGSPAPPIRRGRIRPWSRPGSILSARMKVWCCFSSRLSTHRNPRPATSRAILRGCGRTAASTPTPPCGWPWPWPARGMGSGRCSCCACSIRSSTPAMRQRSGTTGLNPTWLRPTSTACPAGLARAAGPGIPVRRPGCTGPGLKRSWACRCGAMQMRINPVIPATWPGFSLRYRHGETIYAIQVENPDGCEHGVAWVEMDGQRLTDGVIPLERGLVKHQLSLSGWGTWRIRARTQVEIQESEDASQVHHRFPACAAGTEI